MQKDYINLVREESLKFLYLEQEVEKGRLLVRFNEIKLK